MMKKQFAFCKYLFFATLLTAAFIINGILVIKELDTVNSAINVVYAQENTSEHIESFNAEYNINPDGTVDVIETIKYFFPDSRHGIFRYIPYTKTNTEGEKFKLKIDDISVTNESGKPYKYEKSIENESINLKIGDPNRTVTGDITYIIKYRVSGALTYFNDHDEFYWNITGNGWNIPILGAVAKTTIPTDNTSVSAVCYTGPAGSTSQECTTSTTENSALVTSTYPLYAGEGITYAVSFPKGLVEVLEPTKYVNWAAVIGAIVLIFSIAGWYIVLPIYVFLKWYKSYSRTKKAKIVSAWFDPPKDKNGNPLAPAETSVLIDNTVDNKDVTATVVQLSQKGYLKLREEANKGVLGSNKKFNIEITDKNNPELSGFEKLLYDALKTSAGNDNVVNVKSLASSVPFGSKLEKFYDTVSFGLVSKGIFDEDPHKTSGNYLALLGFAMLTLNIPLAIASYLRKNNTLKSELGVEKYAEAQSLKNFLVSQDEKLDFMADKQMFFEKLLPYATSFGVESVWVKRFADLQMQKPDWYEGTAYNAYTLSHFNSSMKSSFSSSHRVATRGSSSSGFSSGFSGGSSGGGGGGGGGGSW